jgi:uncharacterized surface protein with fasciclin (FAS1) repeats
MKPRPHVANTLATRDIVDTAAAEGSFTTFGNAVERAGLTETFRGIGPFTIFAPTDAAFEKLPAGTLDELFKPENQAELASLVNHHVIKGHKTVAELGKWDSARTAHGQMAAIVRQDRQVSIDGAIVTTADIGSTNGILHGIDKVNLPKKL